MIKVLKKYLNRGLFNIGFAKFNPVQLIESGKLPEIKWLRHNYNDRFFADPFILSIENGKINCLVEEFKYEGIGTLNWLTIDENTMELIDNTIILEANTHLSYPAYFKVKDQIYVYPENGKGGELALYHLDQENKKLSKVRSLVAEPLVDSTIIEYEGAKYLICTKISDHPFKHAYLYKALDNLKFKCIEPKPIVSSISYSRPGGNFFTAKGNLYRPAQDCNGRYGKALHIMKIISFEPYLEHEVLVLKPQWKKYSLRLHTINFHNSGWMVIDACGYVHPILGRILCPLYDLALRIKGINYFK